MMSDQKVYYVLKGKKNHWKPQFRRAFTRREERPSRSMASTECTNVLMGLGEINNEETKGGGGEGVSRSWGVGVHVEKGNHNETQ